MSNTQKLIQTIKNNPKKIGAFVAFAGMVTAIRYFQKFLLYIPVVVGWGKSPRTNPYPYQNPTQFGHRLWQDIEIVSSDNTAIRGWFIKNEGQSTKRIIVYFHENAGNIGMRIPFVTELVRQTQSHVLLIAYRGYSDSDGQPSENGLKKDSIAILQKAVQLGKQYELPVVIFGRSLGGAAAIYSSSQPQFINQASIKGLILENTFLSISRTVSDLIPFLPIRLIFSVLSPLLISNKWQSYKKISSIKVPVMFIKSCKDQLIKKEQMDALQQLNQSLLKYRYEIINGTHNESWTIEPDRYFVNMNQFLSRL